MPLPHLPSCLTLMAQKPQPLGSFPDHCAPCSRKSSPLPQQWPADKTPGPIHPQVTKNRVDVQILERGDCSRNEFLSEPTSSAMADPVSSCFPLQHGALSQRSLAALSQLPTGAPGQQPHHPVGHTGRDTQQRGHQTPGPTAGLGGDHQQSSPVLCVSLTCTFSHLQSLLTRPPLIRPPGSNVALHR